MAGLLFLQLKNGVLLYIVCFDMVLMAKQKKVFEAAPLLIGHLRIEALSARTGSFDVTDFPDKAPLVVHHGFFALREGASVSRVQIKTSQNFTCDG